MLEERVASFLHQMRRSNPLAGAHLLVGVSGGPDSMALLAILSRLQQAFDYGITAVHVNHQLRGEEAELDQALVFSGCKKWKIPCESQYVDVREYMQQQQIGVEEAARILRYQVFKDVATRLKATHLFLAHHADDQTETVLMRLYRGTGMGGLKGMVPLRAWEGRWLVRPLLQVWRDEIEAYCHQQKIPYRLDSTNQALEYERNWLRHQHIPQLEQLYPQVKRHIVQLAQLLAAEDEYLERETKRRWEQIVNYQEVDQRYEVGRKAWCRTHIALQRRLVKLILNCLSPTTHIGRVHVDQVIHFMESDKTTGVLHLPERLRVQCSYEYVYFYQESDRLQRDRPYPIKLSIPSTVHIPQLGWQIEIDVTEKLENMKPFSQTVVFDYDQLNLPLQFRARESGDVMSCFGMQGRKRIKDLFIDAKVPVHQREIWPILTDQEQILWVPFLRRSNVAPVSDQTKRFLHMRVETTRIGEDVDEARY